MSRSIHPTDAIELLLLYHVLNLPAKYLKITSLAASPVCGAFVFPFKFPPNRVPIRVLKRINLPSG